MLTKEQRERRARLLKEGMELCDRARAENRDFTQAEQEKCTANLDAVRQIDAAAEAASKSDDIMEKITGLFTKASDNGAGKVLSFAGMGAKALRTAAERDMPGVGVKALAATGVSLLTEESLIDSPVALGQPASSLLDLIPVKTVDTGRYSYLRQVTRTNLAAPVAAGDLKPTSTYTLTRIEGELNVIAHLSEAIPESWLVDNTELGTFIDSEMNYGLQVEIENQVINGNGTAPQLAGFANVSGIQTVPFATDPVTTCRTAITAVETIGLQAGSFVLNPSDWAAIETLKETGVGYLLEGAGAPIDRIARRLWGVPVAVSNAVPAGTGWLLAKEALMLVSSQVVSLKWAQPRDLFERNQILARCEGRFELAIPRPAGVVKMTLTDA
ncbi:HK97 family phage major capsid protein [Flexivirga oryzae]|uniref:HK97 family phage major capsid protein n=2 Tax=Flexivirga oryzae TaxID=1794944 RepID=A0A839NAF1_9MICO|nr:HK97 family phage major capsid protein [Flexivirga oryzae]